MVLLSRPRKVKPYLQVETNPQNRPTSKSAKTPPVRENIIIHASRLVLHNGYKSQQLVSHLMAPLTRATSSGEEAMKTLVSWGEGATSPSGPKPSTWSARPS